MTEEDKMRCATIIVAVTAVTGSLAEVLPTMQDIHVALKAALFLTEKFLANPNSKAIDYKDQLKAMVMKEMGTMGMVN